MPTIRLSQVTKRFAPSIVAVQELELTVRHRELLVLVGPSGSGKSTTLRLIAGLDRPTSGEIFFDDEAVTKRPPVQRRVGMVFQGENLFPHLSVRDNLAVGLSMRRTPRSITLQRTAETAERLGLESLLDRWPQQLSGGERQRVALARLLIGQPQVCLLDEPLSNVDPAQRGVLRDTIRQVHRQTQATSVFVTHDQQEAMSLGERVAIMHQGRIVQVGTPQAVYQQPVNSFAARFLGSPPMNLFLVRVAEGRLQGLEQEINVPARDDGPLLIGIRPESLTDSHAAPIRLQGSVNAVEFWGSERVLHLTGHGTQFSARLSTVHDHRVGATVNLGCFPQDVYLFATEPPEMCLGTLNSLASHPHWPRRD